MKIGEKVKIRKERMYELIDSMIKIDIKRVRELRGMKKKRLEGSGKYEMGIKEKIVLKEIKYDKVDKIWGMEIIV